jgi:F0F1-type ATP synthase alpha subunit
MGVSGYLDAIPVSKITEFERWYLEYMQKQHNDILKIIKKEHLISEQVEKKLHDIAEKAVERYKEAHKTESKGE